MTRHHRCRVGAERRECKGRYGCGGGVWQGLSPGEGFIVRSIHRTYGSKYREWGAKGCCFCSVFYAIEVAGYTDLLGL